MNARSRTKIALAGLILLVLSWKANAQVVDAARPNQIGLELLGRAFIYSVSYERFVASRIGVGLGAAAWGINNHTTLIMPAYVFTNPIGNRHSLYLSGGATVGIGTETFFDQPTAALGVLTAGYQYTSSSGLVLRPTLNLVTDLHSRVYWPGFTIARRF